MFSARSLCYLGRKVTILTAPGNLILLKAMLAFEKEENGYEIPLIECPLITEIMDQRSWAIDILKGIDTLISIEILGKAK